MRFGYVTLTMPLYKYRCQGCSRELEVLAKMTDPPPKCEICGMETTKLVSKSSFQLKGSGWAKDGYS